MGQARVPTVASFEPLFGFLRALGVMPPEPAATPTAIDELLCDYRNHLTNDRGLTATTVRRYMNFALRFLSARALQTGSDTGVEGLTSSDVNAYILQVSARLV